MLTIKPLIKDFLTAVGYSFNNDETTTLTNLETDETASLVSFNHDNGAIHNYEFKKSKLTIEQCYNESISTDSIKLVTPEVTYQMDIYYFKDHFINKKITIKTHNGPSVIIDFNIYNSFNNTTKTIIKHSNGGRYYLASDITSDITKLKFTEYYENYLGPTYTTMDISVKNYIRCIYESLVAIFGPTLSAQIYQTIGKIITGLSDNVQIMLDPSTNERKQYLTDIETKLATISFIYKEKFGQLLSEMEKERKTLEEYKEALESPNIKR